MDKLTNKAAQGYLRQVRGLLPCSRGIKDEITAPLRKSLDAFLAEEPAADAEAVKARFGTPEAIAASCLENTDTGEVLRRLKTKRRIVTIAVTAVIVLLLTWGCFLLGTYQKLKTELFNGHAVVSEIQVDSTSIE